MFFSAQSGLEVKNLILEIDEEDRTESEEGRWKSEEVGKEERKGEKKG